MATFEAWYTTEDYGKLWFEAEDKAQAQELLSAVSQGQLSITDLPLMQSFEKGYEVQFDMVERVDN